MRFFDSVDFFQKKKVPDSFSSDLQKGFECYHYHFIENNFYFNGDL